jgi:hypothetical protein
VFKSTDGGRTWARTSLGPSGIYVWTLGADPKDANTLYAGTNGRGLYETTDGGIGWTAINNGLTDLNPRAVVVDPNDSNTVYVGTADSGMFKSTDGGNHWSRAGLAGEGINSLSLDPQNSQVLYAGGSPGLWKSLDGGHTWLNIMPNLTVSRAGGILIDPTDSNTLYVGTEDRGVFMSSDGGHSWSPLNDGLTNLTVYAMAMDPQDPHTIYAGTVASSVFVLHLEHNPGPPGPGGASGRGAGEGLPKHLFPVGALLVGTRIVSAPWPPSAMGPSDGAWQGPLASPRLRDSLFAATAGEEPVRSVSEIPPVRHAASSDGRWQPLRNDLDLLEQTIATLA